MTQSIRDAAQALIDCYDDPKLAGQMHQRIEALVSALSAPQPTADERLERLLSDVEMYGHANAVETRNDAFRGHESMAGRPQYDLPAMYAEIEQSARALLSASQEDAEHAAMYRWLREGDHDLYITTGDLAGDGDGEMVPAALSGSIADNAIRAAIRAAMSAKETK